jgi:hypothetical protein
MQYDREICLPIRENLELREFLFRLDRKLLQVIESNKSQIPEIAAFFQQQQEKFYALLDARSSCLADSNKEFFVACESKSETRNAFLDCT